MFEPITIKKFLTKDECDTILSVGKTQSLLLSKVGDYGIYEKVRKSKHIFLEFKNIENKINIEIKKLNIPYDLNYNNYKFQFTKYEIGDFFNWHSDSGKNYENRIVSVVLQLNSEYEGGTFSYRKMNGDEIEFEKGEGNLYIFNSSLYHRVQPITNGERYSLVHWYDGKIKNIKNKLI